MTGAEAIDAVVFDLGGVLIDWDPRYLFRKLLPEEVSVDRFLTTVCTPAWNARQDAGRPFSTAVEELVAASARGPARLTGLPAASL